jgi:hypothetical protein
MTAATGAGQALTDGTGVSPLSWRKLIKDFIADALITAAAALATASIAGVPTDEQGWLVAATAIGTAILKAAYRAALRWATTD